MAFDTLPLEIKLLIIAKLTGDNLTLARLGACNKELARLSGPTQWSHIRLGAVPSGTDRALSQTHLGIQQDAINYRIVRYPGT